MRVSYFNKVNEDGKVEIPKEFLKRLGINEDDELEIIIEKNEIKIAKIK